MTEVPEDMPPLAEEQTEGNEERQPVTPLERPSSPEDGRTGEDYSIPHTKVDAVHEHTSPRLQALSLEQIQGTSTLRKDFKESRIKTWDKQSLKKKE